MRLVPAAAVALVLAGCGGGGGGGGDSKPSIANTPVAVAQAYADALGSGDYATDCALISKNTRIQVTRNGKVACEKVFGKAIASVGAAKDFFANAKASAPKVKGDNATVTITPDNGKPPIQLPLVREGGRWKVSQ